MRSSSPMKTPKLQLATEQPSTGECWIPPKKDTPCPRAKEKPQQDTRTGKITNRNKLHWPEMHGGLKHSLVHTRTQRPNRDWARPAFECFSVSCRGTGQQWPAAGTEALGARDVGRTPCGISPFEGVTINSTIELWSRRLTNCRTIIPNKLLHC